MPRKSLSLFGAVPLMLSMRKQILFLAGAVAVLSALAAQSRADHWPSFYLERCVWEATDIIVAHQERDLAVLETDEVTVLETWKGDLEAGTVIRGIRLPIQPIRIGGKPGELWYWDHGVPPKKISGERIVLFLKHPEAKAGEPPKADQWIGAGEGIPNGREMVYSVVWLDEDQAYAMNGNLWPLRLARNDHPGEKDLKQATLDILAAKSALEKAESNTDLSQRVELLAPMVKSPCWRARREAITALGESGPVAAPVLEKMLREYEWDLYTSSLVHALARAYGDQAGSEMTRWLKEELVYWKKTAPGRPREHFWDIGGDHLRHHTIEQVALYVVKQLHYLPAWDVARELRDFWVALPRRDTELDKRTIQQTADQCERVLLALDEDEATPKGE